MYVPVSNEISQCTSGIDKEQGRKYVWTTEGSEFESREGQEFSLLQIVQTGSEVHPTYYPMGTGGSFPGGKAGGA
jgi:hypothetical protein